MELIFVVGDGADNGSRIMAMSEREGLRKAALDGVTNCLAGMSDHFDFDNCHGDRLSNENTTQEMVIILQSQEAILRALLCILKESG